MGTGRRSFYDDDETPRFLRGGDRPNGKPHHARPSRRHADEEPQPDYFPPEATAFHARPASSFSPQDADTLTGRVEWFNPTKGFGFVKFDNSPDAFLPMSAVEAYGRDTLRPGTTITCEVRGGNKVSVVSIVSIDESTAEAARPRPQSSGGRPAPVVEQTVQGTVKFFNPDKGFGFMTGPGFDAFVHVSALQRSGISAIVEGETYMMGVAKGDKGYSVVSLSKAP